MSVNRIQKLILSEYSDFEDMVLVESPFAQTTRDGNGIRQVHLGLTPSKLVLATDKIRPARESSIIYLPGLDPDIETFELVAVYPLECINLSVFHRRKRRSIKLHFCTNRILYFELGGFQKRNMFWNMWCDKIKYMNSSEVGSSQSETSVASSTTNSTLYLVSRRHVTNDKGVRQLWCKFARGDHISYPQWKDRHLYLGSEMEDSPMSYTPNMLHPSPSQFINRKKISLYKLSIPSSTTNSMAKEMDEKNRLYQINRFGSGIKENCSTGLFLPFDENENLKYLRRFSQTTQSSEFSRLTATSYLDFCEIAESSVRLWENFKHASSASRPKHKRRYAFAPQPHFLHGLGPWNVSPGAKYTLQVKRVASEVTIRKPPTEPELRLPVSKRQLVASISCEALHLDSRLMSSKTNIPQKTPAVVFWTPDYWYRPRSAREAYQETLNHLGKINKFHQQKSKKKDLRSMRKKLFRNKRKIEKESLLSDSDGSLDSPPIKKRLKKGYSTKFFNMFNNRQDDVAESTGFRSKKQETSLQYLRRTLRMDVALTAWDFDSTTIANQMTLIDKELFLKIPASELSVLIWQQSSKNAPNIGALLAFSHRISCLVATEILRDDSEKIRARLVARFINTADKCNRLLNFQSCRSILCGLQSPPIYRLHSTWTHVRKKHATKYLIFEQLCRLHRDPRTPVYQKTFLKATENSAYLPCIVDIVAKLLDKLPEYGESLSSKRQPIEQSNTVKTTCDCKLKPKTPGADKPCIKKETPGIIRKLLSTLKVWPTSENYSKTVTISEQNVQVHFVMRHKTNQTNLIDMYKPLDVYEDNRLERLNEAIKMLEKFQKAAVNYVIGTNELAREYLLKARYREDRENFFNSFNVEQSVYINKTIVKTVYLSNK